MTHDWPDTFYCLLILLMISIVIRGDPQNYKNVQRRKAHLPDKKFSFNDYAEYPEENEPEPAESDPVWNRVPLRNIESFGNQPIFGQSQLNLSSSLDSNIKWDKSWYPQLDSSQLSAVDIDPNGNIALFTRGKRVWGQSSFDLSNVFDREQGPIKQDTIILIDKTGKILFKWGRNIFYMPHGLTIDTFGNYWLTDVGMHQVFKFTREEIEQNMEKLKNIQNQPELKTLNSFEDNDLFRNSIIKPSLVLGIAFEPGNDKERFCKPTAVAVAKNGDFFVSDGYCNSRLIKFNSKGERILTIGRSSSSIDNYLISPYMFYVPHALAIAHELDFIYVADREHGRVLCFSAQNGSFHKEYKNPVMGTRIYSVDYARDKIYLVNGPTPYNLNKFHVRGFVMDIKTGDVVSQFGPDGDMFAPHDIAVSDDGSEIYVPELDKSIVYKFLQGDDSKVSSRMNLNKSVDFKDRFRLGTYQQSAEKDIERSKPTTLILTIVISTLILIGLCVAVAAVVARCQKRGRFSRNHESNVEFTKLVE